MSTQICKISSGGGSSIIVLGTGTGSSLRCGNANTASGSCATVLGICNSASNGAATISGGFCNNSTAGFATIGGGLCHVASGCVATISGGYNNTASGGTSFVGGGCLHTSSGSQSVVIGGICNIASGLRSANVGGFKNLNNSFDGFIGGGNCNNVCNVTNGCLAYGAVVAGGVGNNTTGGTWSFASGVFTVAPTICNAGQYSFIGGGFQNRATGNSSVVVGGQGNSSCSFSAIVGGTANCALGDFSFVGGGGSNSANAYTSAIVGGQGNKICSEAQDSVIVGGFINTICSGNNTGCGSTNNWASFIGGGSRNVINQILNNLCSDNYVNHVLVGGRSNTAGYSTGSGYYEFNYPSTLVGGFGNNSVGSGSFVGGGYNNRANDVGSTASGGSNNTAGSCFSTIGGGSDNTTTGNNSVVGGGTTNNASADSATIAGGRVNTASGFASFIGSGSFNSSSGYMSAIVGGCCNVSSGRRSAIGGGTKNTNNTIDGFIGGGNCNNVFSSVSGCLSFGAVVVGGVGNNTTGGTWNLSTCSFSVAPTICDAGQYSFVGGGFQNRASGSFSGVLGGQCNNVALCANTFIVGSCITADRVCATFVNNLSIKNIPTAATGLPSGSVWRNGNVLNIVP